MFLKLTFVVYFYLRMHATILRQRLPEINFTKSLFNDFLFEFIFIIIMRPKLEVLQLKAAKSFPLRDKVEVFFNFFTYTCSYLFSLTKVDFVIYLSYYYIFMIMELWNVNAIYSLTEFSCLLISFKKQICQSTYVHIKIFCT